MKNFLYAGVFAVAICIFTGPAQAEDAAAAGASVPAAAVEQADPAAGQSFAIQVPMDAQMKKALADYQAASAALSAEQQSSLAATEQAFSDVMSPSAAVLATSADIKYCLGTDEAFAKKVDTYQKAFVTWRDAQNALHQERWRAHKDARAKLDFVDQAMLDQYYIFRGKVALYAATAMNQKAAESGAREGLDCAALGQLIDTGRIGE
jgi:hypothetical protein